MQLSASIEVETFPSWWLAIKIIDLVTAGIALFVLEFGAGAAIRYAWLRWGKRAELSQVDHLLGVINDRHQARARINAQGATPIPPQPSFVKVGVQVLAERIDRDLAPSVAKVSAIKEFVTAGAPSGSLFEADAQETNLPVLEQQIALCHDARDRLLRLGDQIV